MRNKLKGVVFLAGMACVHGVLAESASEQLTRIEAETLLLKAREKQLDVKANIIAKENEIENRRKVNEQFSQARTPAHGDPLIRSVESIGSKTYATLVLASGSIVDAKVGDTLPNGMHVVSIKPNEVVVRKGRKTHIRLAAEPRTPSMLQAGFPPGVLPPLPVLAPRGGVQ